MKKPRSKRIGCYLFDWEEEDGRWYLAIRDQSNWTVVSIAGGRASKPELNYLRAAQTWLGRVIKRIEYRQKQGGK